MLLPLFKSLLPGTALAGVLLLGPACLPARAQSAGYGGQSGCPSPCPGWPAGAYAAPRYPTSPVPQAPAFSGATPAAPAAPASQAPAAQPSGPQTPQAPSTPSPQQTPETQTPQQNEQAQQQAQEPSLGQEQAAATGGETVALGSPGGYIDDAIPQTQFKLRYDAAFDVNRPDRAEFFWSGWNELAQHPHGVQGGGTLSPQPKARGPKLLPDSLDYQEITTVLELAYNNRVSAFVELPVRFIHFNGLERQGTEEESDSAAFPEGENFSEHTQEKALANKRNFSGFSDLVVGFKGALVAEPDRYLTFQFRTYTPTGDAGDGLGTGHVSLEPGLLAWRRLDRLQLQAQFRDWIPLDGSVLAGNILIYGVGASYDVYQSCNLRVTPVVEFVGWTVLSGFESFIGPLTVAPAFAGSVPTTHGVMDATGDTIVNAKVGVRTYLGQHSDVYVGYGQALTSDRWYQDIVRVEYRLKF